MKFRRPAPGPWCQNRTSDPTFGTGRAGGGTLLGFAGLSGLGLRGRPAPARRPPRPERGGEPSSGGGVSGSSSAILRDLHKEKPSRSFCPSRVRSTVVGKASQDSSRAFEVVVDRPPAGGLLASRRSKTQPEAISSQQRGHPAVKVALIGGPHRRSGGASCPPRAGLFSSSSCPLDPEPTWRRERNSSAARPTVSCHVRRTVIGYPPSVALVSWPVHGPVRRARRASFSLQ
jgi:hypothetical protein